MSTDMSVREKNLQDKDASIHFCVVQNQC